jgi:hypothetical protein
MKVQVQCKSRKQNAQISVLHKVDSNDAGTSISVKASAHQGGSGKICVKCLPNYLSKPKESVPGMLTGLELRKPVLTSPCEMELPEQFRDLPPSPSPEQLRDFSPSEKPLDLRDLLPSYRSVMLISSNPSKKEEAIG